jgi:transposase InsO family protein
MASPAFIVMKAVDELKDKTTAPNQLWPTGFTYIKEVLPVGVLDDFSRYTMAWKLCTSMKAEDVTATFEMAVMLRSSWRQTIRQWLLMHLRRPGQMAEGTCPWAGSHPL